MKDFRLIILQKPDNYFRIIGGLLEYSVQMCYVNLEIFCTN